MNRTSLLTAVLLMLVFTFVPISVKAQAPAQPAQSSVKPYHDGPVWNIAFVRSKAGMEDRYLRYLATEWKREQEAMKKAGYTLDYKVITTEAHGPQDYNVILMTQFKDLATLEANVDRMEALAQQLFGGQQGIESGYQDRASYREVMGDRLGREIILSPRTAGMR